MPERHPTLWETYEFIFQALEAGRATVRDAREFHRLMLLGPSDGRMRRVMELRKKLGIVMVPEGQITSESLLAYARQHEGDRKYDTRTISRKLTKDGEKTRFEEVIHFVPRSTDKSKNTRWLRGSTESPQRRRKTT